VDITDITCIGNTAGSATEISTACMDVYSSQVQVNGRFCAYNNTSEAGSSQASVSAASINVYNGDSVLQFNNTLDGSNMANNLPVSVALQDDNQITCGSNISRSWQVGSYNITGQVCACDGEFVDGNSTTCDTCGEGGWDTSHCACVSIKLGNDLTMTRRHYCILVSDQCCACNHTCRAWPSQLVHVSSTNAGTLSSYVGI
jgi:hypothetical protein